MARVPDRSRACRLGCRRPPAHTEASSVSGLAPGGGWRCLMSQAGRCRLGGREHNCLGRGPRLHGPSGIWRSDSGAMPIPVAAVRPRRVIPGMVARGAVDAQRGRYGWIIPAAATLLYVVASGERDGRTPTKECSSSAGNLRSGGVSPRCRSSVRTLGTHCSGTTDGLGPRSDGGTGRFGYGLRKGHRPVRPRVLGLRGGAGDRQRHPPSGCEKEAVDAIVGCRRPGLGRTS